MLAFFFFFIKLALAGGEEPAGKWSWPVPAEVPGTWYEATVPDTLDLAERAEIALNVLTGALDPNYNYEIFFHTTFKAQPPFMGHECTGLPTNNPKFAESLVMMREMSGSNFNRDIETHMMEYMVTKATGADGLYYSLKEGRPWHGAGEDFANVYGNTRYLLAMIAWHHFTQEPAWKSRVDAVINRLSAIALQKDDYVYYPVSNIGEWFSWGRQTGWLSKDEPMTGAPGEHPTVLYLGPVLRGLAKAAEITDNPNIRQLGDRLVNFIKKPRHWNAEVEAKHVHGPSRAHWCYHFHGWVAALRGLLDYAMLTGDADLKEFVRDGYDCARNYGIPRIGWFPEVTNEQTQCESCCIADMVALPIKLNDAGVGDYWDDVERYVRNQLVEQQYIDADLLRKVSQAGAVRKVNRPRETDERVIERNLGGFAGRAMVDHDSNPWNMHCCTGNGTEAIYYAWEAITRFHDGVAQVNLLLNRASPWMDIDSYLPYEGQVVLKNKQARAVSVRIPRWVDKSEVKVKRSGGKSEPIWSGPNLVCTGLGADEVITITFPVEERIEKAVLYGTEYTFTFRGNTVVDVKPRSQPAGSYPFYQRSHMRTGKAPMKTKKRFVSKVMLPW
ncbi:MAG: glycoside hydrolase family 127 protein [Planctomycetes bacterium]|nr:glycoside hydrolase family 127 protein [Planctomycetota bacterium]